MPIKNLDLNLLPTLKKVDIRAKRRVLSRVLEGSWTAMMKGRGMEFAGFRQYTYGDDASRIDWGATLRSKETLIREFEEFKNVTVFLLLDVSETMLFSSVGKLKAEHGAELLFNLAAAILDNGDSVGFAMFNDDVVAKMQPGIGKEVLYRMANELQKPKNYGGGFSLKPVIRLLENFLHQRALVILVSDFIGMDEGWERYVKMISQKHDLITITLRDPRDQEMPSLPAQVLVEDPLSGEKLFIDAKQYRKIYNDSVQKEELYLKSVFEKAKAGNVFVSTGNDTLAPLLSYFRKRAAIIRG